MNRNFSLLILLAVAANAAAHQETEEANEEVAVFQSRSKGFQLAPGQKKRIETLEEEMNDVYTDTTRGTFGAKAASARPQLDSIHLFVSVDAIYWKAFEGGTDYASTTTLEAPYQGASKRIDFDWMWGFKTELGYRLPHDGWDLAAHYTWFYDKGKSSIVRPTNGGVVPLLPIYYTNEALAGNGNWNFHFSDLDLSLQKSYFLSPFFSMAPSAGLRTSWIRQNVDAIYLQADAPTEVDITGKNNFWGIGPKFGCKTNWFIDNQWHFFAGAAGSLLYGEFDVRATQTNDASPVIDLDGNLQRIVPTIQGSIGAGWEMNFLKNRYHLAINVSYEGQYWWRQNQLFSYTNPTSVIIQRESEDLGMHGLTMNALFDF